MKIIIQRVNNASVCVDGNLIGKISKGLLILVGYSKDFHESKLDYFIQKILNLRIFNSKEKGFDLSIQDIKGELLIVSQFTLHGKIEGNRINFNNSLEYDKAKLAYDFLISKLKKECNLKIQSGEFGSYMKVNLENDGPVTITLEK